MDRDDVAKGGERFIDAGAFFQAVTGGAGAVGALRAGQINQIEH